MFCIKETSDMSWFPSTYVKMVDGLYFSEYPGYEHFLPGYEHFLLWDGGSRHLCHSATVFLHLLIPEYISHVFDMYILQQLLQPATNG